MPGPSSALQEVLRASLREGGVRVALLFGSHARGTAKESSDLDLAVLAEGIDLLALAAAVGRASGLEADLVSLDDVGIPLLEEILRDGVTVYEERPGAGAAWRSRALALLETDRPWFARMREAWLRRVAERGL